MKNYKTITVAAIGLAVLTLSAVTSQATISLPTQISGGNATLSGGNLSFSTFSFVDSTAFAQVAGASVVIGGTYAIGTPGPIFPITGSGNFTLNDGSGYQLTGTISWISIAQQGGGTTVNVNSAFNLIGLSYNGSDASLIALANGGVAQAIATFQLGAGTLGNYAGPTGATTTSSASLTLTPIPEPSTVAAGALLLLPFGIGAIRSLRKDRTA